MSLLPPRTSAPYGSTVGHRLDTPGIAHRDHRPVPPDLGRRIITALHALNQPAREAR